ncbi:unnamed protein product [Paramecium pentaurelia]|uniref:Uncharacterized protein n=1 Tax=Paramecium pentaurelia TaxID=43138 RepID=A0A8S1SJX8_9CILI|nr:unnamed protein product [Paramecium pentaurelia]
MGNNCQQSNKTVNLKEQVISIIIYHKLKLPNKQILLQPIQNLSQNLDTFEEDFYQNEFLLDFINDDVTNHCSHKKQIESLDNIEQIIMQCPTQSCVCESQIEYQINLNLSDDDPLNKAFIRLKKKKEKRPQHRNKKQLKKPVQIKLELKSILKNNKPNHSSLSNISNKSAKLLVKFNLSPYKINQKNTKSLSPILLTDKSKIKNVQIRSMQHFPYL